MDEQERKWVETNNVVCALLRQAHDALAASSLPMKRPWVGLTPEDMPDGNHPVFDSDEFILGVAWAQAKLKEKNT